MPGPFGRRLREWRGARGLTQLELAHAAGVSPRHLSFVETGRSRPGEDVVLRLARALALAPRDTNGLLEAAGLAALYPAASTDDRRFEPYRRVLERMMAAHEPFPCLILDRYWNLVDANRSARRLFGVDGPLPAEEVLRRLYGPGPLRDSLKNWPVVAWAALDRLRTEARDAGGPLVPLVALVEGWLVGVPRPRVDTCGQGLAVCPVFAFGGQEVRTLSTLTRFVSALDVGVDELRIEHVFPADDASEAVLRALAAGGANPAGTSRHLP